MQIAHFLTVRSTTSGSSSLAAVVPEESFREPSDAASLLPARSHQNTDNQRHHQDAQSTDDDVRHFGESAVRSRAEIRRTGIQSQDAGDVEVRAEDVSTGRCAQVLSYLAGSGETFFGRRLDALAVVDFKVNNDTSSTQSRIQVRVSGTECLGWIVGGVPRVNHFVALRISLNPDGGAEFAAHVADKSHTLILESGQIHFQDEGNGTHGQNRWFVLAIQSVPVAFRRVASVVAVAVGVVRLTVRVVDRITRLHLAAAVVAVEQAFRSVTFFVTFVVLEQLPAAQRRRAVGPRTRHSQRTITAVEIASCVEQSLNKLPIISINLHKIQPALTESVAVFIANSVSGFLVAALLSAFNLFQLQIVGNGRHPLSFAAHSARESRIVHFALLAVPCGRAHAVEFSNFILNIIRTIQIRNRN